MATRKQPDEPTALEAAVAPEAAPAEGKAGPSAGGRLWRVSLSETSPLVRFVDSVTHLEVTREPRVVDERRIGDGTRRAPGIRIEPVEE